MAAPLYELYGMRVRSAIALPARLAAAGHESDLEIFQADSRPIPNTAAAGEPIAHRSWGERGYAATRSPRGITFRFFGSCDVEISSDGQRASVYLAPGVSADLAGTLLSGTVLALILALRGECVLHASAVTVGDACLAFVGDAGSGKSTLAALACVRGAALLTDDVLCVGLAGGAPSCKLGSRELRLRDSAVELVERLRKTRAHRTVDERWAVEPSVAAAGEPRLQALFFPQPSRDVASSHVRRMSSNECVLALIRRPRLAGLREPQALRNQLGHFATLARRLPAFDVTIPWGPPFDARVLDPVFGACSVELAETLPATSA